MSDLEKEVSDTYVNKLYAESRHRKEQNRDLRARNKEQAAEIERMKDFNLKLQQAHDTLKSELETLKQSPDAVREELEALKGQLRDSKHKDAFKRLAESNKVKSEAVDDLYRLVDYKADTDDVDEGRITSMIQDAVKSRPYFLAEEASEQPVQAPQPSFPAPGYSRGAAERGPSGLTIRQSELSKVALNPALAAQYKEAFDSGTLRVIAD